MFRRSFDATRSREIKITLIVFQFAAFAMTAAYLALSVAGLHRRNRGSWESLLSRLHPAWVAGPSAAVAVLGSAPSTRWTVFQDSGVLMQMADFAERNGSAIDPSVLASLRTEAVGMRFAVLHSYLRRTRVL